MPSRRKRWRKVLAANQPLVYGVDQHENLVVLPENVAQRVRRDFERISTVRTYGAARRLNDDLEYLALPLGDEEEDDAEPYDPWKFEDFPPNPATIALDELPEWLELGQEIDGFPLAPYLYINPAEEGRLLKLVRAEGYAIRRDDDLVRNIYH